MGNRPALTPSESAYQRMLARDLIEAAEQAQCFLKERSSGRLLRRNIEGALTLAWADAQRARLDEQQAQRIRDTVSEIVEDLEVHKHSENARSTPEKEGALSNDLKPFIAIQRVQHPPGKGEPASRKRALHG